MPIARLVAGLALAWLLAAPAAAGIYRWTDAEGREHFTTDLHKVPARYRAAAEAASQQAPKGHLNRAEGTPVEAVPTMKLGAPAARSEPDERPGGLDEQTWRSRRKTLVTRIDWLQTTIDACPSGPPRGRNADGSRRMKRQHYDRKSTQWEQCSNAKAQLTGAELALRNFDERARRAGVPPGWLR